MKRRYIQYGVDGTILAEGIADTESPPAFFPQISVDIDTDIKDMMVHTALKTLVKIPPKRIAEAKIEPGPPPPDIVIAETKKSHVWDIVHLIAESVIILLIVWIIYNHTL